MTAPFRISIGLALAASALGCSSVRSTSVATGAAQAGVDPAHVAVAATFVPEGAVQLAVVETHGNMGEGIEALMLGFRTEVGARGGNFGKVDSMRTRFEMQVQTSVESYACGTPSATQTCSRTVTRHVEVGTTTVMGRAFRVGGVQ